jgi:hypothetical protein
MGWDRNAGEIRLRDKEVSKRLPDKFSSGLFHHIFQAIPASETKIVSKTFRTQSVHYY